MSQTPTWAPPTVPSAFCSLYVIVTLPKANDTDSEGITESLPSLPLHWMDSTNTSSNSKSTFSTAPALPPDTYIVIFAVGKCSPAHIFWNNSALEASVFFMMLNDERLTVPVPPPPPRPTLDGLDPPKLNASRSICPS